MRALYIVTFAVGLLLSVMLHEAGHFFTARRYGMKATQFFVGFGPTLWSRHKGETEYGVKAIPAGGFVKIIGMTPLEEVEAGDEDRAFFRQPAGRKTVVLAAGSTVHFIICALLVLGVTAFYGTPTERAPKVGGVTECVANEPDAKCTDPGSVPGPALAAGLKPGDVVVAVDGRSIDSAEGLTSAIRARAGKATQLEVQRAGATLQLTVTPAGVDRKDDAGVVRSIGAIGIGVQSVVVNEHYGVVGTVRESGRLIGTLVSSTHETLTKKLGTITKVYSDDRDPAGFIGLVGAGRVSGDIGAADASWQDKAYSMVLLLAGLNLFVGIFNLLPLLPLDGGHIAVVWFESARDRLRRARGYMGEVKRVDYNKLMPLTLAVVALFVGFTVFLLGADIVNPIRLDQ